MLECPLDKRNHIFSASFSYSNNSPLGGDLQGAKQQWKENSQKWIITFCRLVVLDVLGSLNHSSKASTTPSWSASMIGKSSCGWRMISSTRSLCQSPAFLELCRRDVLRWLIVDWANFWLNPTLYLFSFLAYLSHTHTLCVPTFAAPVLKFEWFCDFACVIWGLTRQVSDRSCQLRAGKIIQSPKHTYPLTYLKLSGK